MTHILASRWARWPRPCGSCIYARFFALSGCGLRGSMCAAHTVFRVSYVSQICLSPSVVGRSGSMSLPWSLRGLGDWTLWTVSADCASMHDGWACGFPY